MSFSEVTVAIVRTARRAPHPVAASYDAGLLQRWLEMPWATEDLRAWAALAALLPEGSVRRGAVDEQVSRLRRSLGESPTS